MEKANIVILGHIDHGKSTLLGRLLYDSGSLPQERIDEVKKTSQKQGKEMEYAFFIDSFEEERENEMTIDIMHIPLKIKDKEYLIIDCPGHKELIKNMLSGASEADSAILIISAKEDEGIQEQTKRHLYLARMLGIKQIFVVVNKLDYTNYSEKRFSELKNSLKDFLKKINLDEKNLFFIPASAKQGENISRKSEKIRWYGGDCLTDLIYSKVSPPASLGSKNFIGLVQDVYDVDSQKIIITKIESGTITQGEEVNANLLSQKGKIKAIKVFGEERNSATAGESVGLMIEGIDAGSVKRGEVLSKQEFEKKQSINGKVFILVETTINEDDLLKITCGTLESVCRLQQINKKVDSSTAQEIDEDMQSISHTEIAEVSLQIHNPIIAEKFEEIPFLGRFILTKESKIVAAGIVIS